jgi:hypothetical protein
MHRNVFTPLSRLRLLLRTFSYNLRQNYAVNVRPNLGRTVDCRAKL